VYVGWLCLEFVGFIFARNSLRDSWHAWRIGGIGRQNPGALLILYNDARSRSGESPYFESQLNGNIREEMEFLERTLSTGLDRHLSKPVLRAGEDGES
jgi:hypothetical protein